MEGIRLIGISICVTTATTAIFSMLVPNQKFNKVLQFAISLFFLTGLISPFFSQKLDFHITLEDDIIDSRESMTAAVSSSVLTIAQTRLENLLCAKLLENGISVFKIKVVIENQENMNNKRNNDIFINQVMVYIDKKDEQNILKIKSLLKQETGISPDCYIVKN